MRVFRTLISILMVAVVAVAVSGQANGANELDVARCWAVQPAGVVTRLATEPDGSRVYAAFEGARVAAFTPDGKKLWSAEFGGEIVSNILTADGSVLFATHTAGAEAKSVLRRVSRDTGIVVHTVILPAAERHFLSLVNGSVAVVSANGVVQLLGQNGDVKWRREIADGFAASPAIGADKLYVASTEKQVFTIHLATGEIGSVQKMPFNITALGATQAGSLLVGDDRGNLTSFAPDGSRAWRFRSGARISRIIPANGHVLALSDDNFVYYIYISNGSVTWKRRLGGRAAYSAVIGGNYNISTSIDEHGAVFTGIENGKAAGQVVLGDEEFVSADPVTGGPIVLIGTNNGIYGYSLSGHAGCPK
jgi:outer membrane protein assembly factor BamB